MTRGEINYAQGSALHTCINSIKKKLEWQTVINCQRMYKQCKHIRNLFTFYNNNKHYYFECYFVTCHVLVNMEYKIFFS